MAPRLNPLSIWEPWRRSEECRVGKTLTGTATRILFGKRPPLAGALSAYVLSSHLNPLSIWELWRHRGASLVRATLTGTATRILFGKTPPLGSALSGS